MSRARTLAKTVARTVADDGRRRHPPAGGYARGDETRSRIISAALDVFGVHGFGGASTRMLAERAGVTLPALQYYFDGKEGVYLACAEHIAERLEAYFGPASGAIADALARERPSRARLRAMLFGFSDRLAELFLGKHELEKWVLFIIREQAQPTPAFEVIYDRVMAPVAATCKSLIGRLLELPASDQKVRMRALMLVGQVVFLRTGREAALRVLGWPDFAGNRLALVKRSLHLQIAAGLAGARRAARRRKS